MACAAPAGLGPAATSQHHNLGFHQRSAGRATDARQLACLGYQPFGMPRSASRSPPGREYHLSLLPSVGLCAHHPRRAHAPLAALRTSTRPKRRSTAPNSVPSGARFAGRMATTASHRWSASSGRAQTDRRERVPRRQPALETPLDSIASSASARPPSKVPAGQRMLAESPPHARAQLHHNRARPGAGAP